MCVRAGNDLHSTKIEMVHCFFPGQDFGPGFSLWLTPLGEGVWGRWLGAPFLW